MFLFSLVYNLTLNRLTTEQPFYGQFNRPTEAAIQAIVTKFRTKFTLLNIKPATRLRRLQTEENIAAVSARVTDDHQLSIRRRSQQFGLRCEASQNTAGTRIEAERLTAMQNFW